jgi:2-dehydropantoate 2-reductase
MGSQKIAVVGTVANGASIDADLTRAGLDVTFIEQWPAHVEAMRKGGTRRSFCRPRSWDFLWPRR